MALLAVKADAPPIQCKSDVVTILGLTRFIQPLQNKILSDQQPVAVDEPVIETQIETILTKVY